MSFFRPDEEEEVVPFAMQYLAGIAHTATSMVSTSFHNMQAAGANMRLRPTDEHIAEVEKMTTQHSRLLLVHSQICDLLEKLAAEAREQEEAL